ncbi:hypothetical protein EO763_09690 [Pectobacterium odoriferum]|nr:hypothetical protein EO763_09690 [Pectobacterium odoriferum]
MPDVSESAISGNVVDKD